MMQKSRRWLPYDHEAPLTDKECQVLADACACALAQGCDHPRITYRLGLYFTALAPRRKIKK